MKLALALFVVLVSQVCADMYLHWPRGSNNRLDEASRNRQTGNRIFDSQNNNRGGYNKGTTGRQYVFTGSVLPADWTNQHSCGNPNNFCELIIQYSCSNDGSDTLMRDGTSRSRIPTTQSNCANENCNTDHEYGMHEDYEWYQHCKWRSRNKGLFTADQGLKGNGAIYTRQNPNGNRNGYECAEERDYYPYWHPTQWKDIAVLTNQPQRCAAYQAESQNVKGRWYCQVTDEYLEGKENLNGFIPITQTECEAIEDAVWTYEQPWNIPAPDCVANQHGRDNHLGNVMGGFPAGYNWTIPDHTTGQRCVYRVRYNISTSEFGNGGWESDTSVQVGTEDSTFNREASGKPSELPIWTEYGLARSEVEDSFDNQGAGRRGYVFENNPVVDMFGDLLTGTQSNGDPIIQLQLAINTAQYGRTFQDRTHVFAINPRPGQLHDAVIHNVGVKGKRGNIVQVFPGVEYDFHPNRLEVFRGDMVHFQWTGSDTNPKNNDGEGPAGYDRSNVLVLRNSNYDETGGQETGPPAETIGRWGNSYPAQIDDPDSPFLGFGLAALQKLAVIGLENSFFDLGPQAVTRSGIYHYMCSRNNNFSNRGQKAKIVVWDAEAPQNAIDAALNWNDGKSVNNIKLDYMTADINTGESAFNGDEPWIERLTENSFVIRPSTMELKEGYTMSVNIEHYLIPFHTAKLTYTGPTGTETNMVIESASYDGVTSASVTLPGYYNLSTEVDPDKEAMLLIYLNLLLVITLFGLFWQWKISPDEKKCATVKGWWSCLVGPPVQYEEEETATLWSGGAGAMSVASSSPSKVMCKAEYDFEGQKEGDLSFKVGDTIEILQRDDPGWWFGKFNGATGMFPSNYVTIIKSSDVEAGGVRMGHAKTPSMNYIAMEETKSAPAPKKVVKTRVDNSDTLWGVYAHNMALYASALCAAMGFVHLIWGSWEYSPSIPTDDARYSSLDYLLGVYFLGLGVAVFAWEWFFGLTREGDMIPLRGFVYILAAWPGFYTTPTGAAATALMCAAVPNFVSGYLREIYSEKKRRARDPANDVEIDCWTKTKEFLGGKNPEGQWGRIIFLFLYVSANLAIGIHSLLARIDLQKEQADNGEETMSNWVPAAKFFGGIMDLNYAILLLPVSRTLVRYLYNLSTGDQTCGTRFCSFIMKLFPLDHAFEFHIECAWVGFWAAIGHTVCHLMNYAHKAQLVWDTFGVGIWVTGGLLLAIIFILYPATHANTKRGHFELFWGTHHLFILFFPITLMHGKGMWNPNYWKWLLVPGLVFICERIYRVVKGHTPVEIVSATHMQSKVLALHINKTGPVAEYQYGQYCYLQCPAVSQFEWHPFTISSAPQERSVSFHIRIQSPGSWTHLFAEYLKQVAGNNRTYQEFNNRIEDADGRPICRVYGPFSAPTQQAAQYNEVMICSSGIGVTPLISAMKSIVHYKWKYASGRAFPDHAHFFWVTSHREIDSFRWMIRTLKEVEDTISQLKSTNAQDMQDKSFQMHIFVTSYKKKRDGKNIVVEDDVGFWGMPRTDEKGIVRSHANWTEMDMYQALINPGADVSFGDVTIHNGRPKWKQYFQHISDISREQDIGVTFCGNPMVGDDLVNMCNKYTKESNGAHTFHLHQEVF